MPTFATPGPITAAVQVAGAQVRVTASDRTDTVVLVEPINGAPSSGDVIAALAWSAGIALVGYLWASSTFKKRA